MQTPRTFFHAMKGRIAGIRERILSLAHQTEAMARQKSLRSLDHYLRDRAGAEEDVISGLQALAEKGLVSIKQME